MHDQVLGLARGAVKVVPYSNQWGELFEAEKVLIMEAIGIHIKDVQHVGSTAVVGLDAKPIIDIAVGVDDFGEGFKCVPGLSALGYEYMKTAGVPGRHFFAKGSDACRTHYVHIEVIGGKLWKNHILFRDYLRDHPKQIEAYASLKRELSQEFTNNREQYTIEKEVFIKKAIWDAERLLVE